ncbi:hypothetical protein ABT039_22060 [Streptomyces lasiicapitis]|uniref:hypothetical protein n=1 Tax=Streptomyces lasiicapitis TaxID=1923961 RepID=UPI0033251BFC
MSNSPPGDEEIRGLAERAVTDATAAWDQLLSAQQAVTRALTDTRRRTTRAIPLKVRTALQSFTRATARFSTATAVLAERWTAVNLPRIYQLGAEEALRLAALAAGQTRPDFTWHAEHQRTLKALTDAAHAVLVRRFTEVVRRCQAFTRAVTAAARRARDASAAALLDRYRLGTVPYTDSRRHPAASWARAAFTAQSVTAANAGALTAAASDLGARWVQVTDGPDCGWSSHTDPDRAHHTMRSATQAAEHLIAHPGCRRAFVPRPDLNDQIDLEEGQSL